MRRVLLSLAVCVVAAAWLVFAHHQRRVARESRPLPPVTPVVIDVSEQGPTAELSDDGTLTTRYPSGAIRSQVRLIEGRPQGTWTTWYETGAKMTADEYVDGVAHGTHRRWNQQGELVGWMSYAHGQRVAPWRLRTAEGNWITETEILAVEPRLFR